MKSQPFHVHFHCSKRHLLCNQSNGALFTCQDDMFILYMWKYHVFVRKLPWYFYDCTHLPVLRVLIVFTKVNILQHQDYPILGTVLSQEVTTAILLYFVPINLRACSPRWWKPPIKKNIVVATNLSMQVFCD